MQMIARHASVVELVVERSCSSGQPGWHSNTMPTTVPHVYTPVRWSTLLVASSRYTIFALRSNARARHKSWLQRIATLVEERAHDATCNAHEPGRHTYTHIHTRSHTFTPIAAPSINMPHEPFTDTEVAAVLSNLKPQLVRQLCYRVFHVRLLQGEPQLLVGEVIERVQVGTASAME